MNIESYFKLFSESLLELSKHPELDTIIESKSLGHFTVYQNNLFNLIAKTIEKDYPTSVLHLENQNFNYIIKDFINKKNLIDGNLRAVSMHFKNHLVKQQETYQDSLLIYLSQIDHLWSFGQLNDSIDSPKGVFKYWTDLYQKKQDIDIDVLTTEFEKIEVKKINNDLILIKRNS